MTNDEFKAQLIAVLQESFFIDVGVQTDVYGINPDCYTVTFRIDDTVIGTAVINGG